MARRSRRGVPALLGWLLVALAAGPLQAAAAVPDRGPVAAGTGLVMVLDASGSTAGKDGSGGTRIGAARKAVGTAVDAMPDGYPTGLRVYGADKTEGCDDTRLVQPVAALDRAGLKKAVAGVRPKGDAPLGPSLRKAAADLPRPAAGALGRRTILLISDGADTCRTPQPCKVAAQLAADGVDLHIDTVGFRVAGRARAQLECVAKAGNGRYYDAPDAKALARRLQRAGQLSAAGYRFKGQQVHGTATRNGAPVLVPGQYLDSLGPHEERYYATDLDAASAADFSATAVPPPGAAVGSLDALRTRVAHGGVGVCDSTTALFGQREGATPLTVGVSRILTQRGTGGCDKAGRYWLVVERRAAKGSVAARWPLELTFHVEHPLEKGVTPARSAPEYGAGGKGATLPATAPEDVTGGTGFNDAPTLHQGVWRDKVRPAQTLWYKVPVGWGQQLCYDVEFGNEPRIQGSSAPASYGRTQVYTPFRTPVGSGTGEFSPQVRYNGRPASLSMGTVPVAWTNRYESHPDVVPVHDKGDFYLSVTLGARASQIAESPQVGVVLRVAVLGKEKPGPQAGGSMAAASRRDSGPSADTAQDSGGGWSTGRVAAVAVGGVGVLLLAGLAPAYVRPRRRPAAADGNADPRRGGSW
ncbi:vWA domain-containing protein [Streptomyces sp. NPDC055299]